MNLPIGGDSSFFLDLYARYLRDPASVPSDWVVHFEDLSLRGGAGAGDRHDGLARRLLDAYRRFGHLEAQLDPLAPNARRVPVLERLRNMVAAEPDRLATVTFAGMRQCMSLSELDAAANAAYARETAVEAGHLHDEAERMWWHEHAEGAAAPTDAETAAVLDSVMLADEFESFMRVRFPTKKRFGSEGAESTIVFLRAAMAAAAHNGVGEIVMGGMHRGRLATLAVALGKDPATLIAELIGRDLSAGESSRTGDVPYHLGYACEVVTGRGPVRVTLLPHPSHLIVVAPVALGLARATAAANGLDATLCMLLHTDAAFAGQGLAAEVLQLGGLAGYSAGGSIHLVVNNQIGFTTLPSEARTALYCTDIGKAVGAPVIHVNGDDPFAVARAAGMAVRWRRQFRKDVLIDLVCYRRAGHNELDEPRFTQPAIWARIDGHPGLRETLARLAAGKPDLLARADAAAADYRTRLRDGYERAKRAVPNDPPIQAPAWSAFAARSEDAVLQAVPTGVPIERLRGIGLAGCRLPSDIDIHGKVRQFYEARREAIRLGEGINFATAEALAFGSLLEEGVKIRLSGQDCVRGTFTQRHLVVHGTSCGRTATPLAAARGTFEVVNSPLSEYGVLGFEYGHSLRDPMQMTVWEAQFGDFLNGAQVMVDQYIVSAEAKWGLLSGLTIMLPHGLEGQGPDHSSARIERLAQLCHGGNIVLAQPSTPANLFHLLRRQIRAPWRKPLFAITPKSLLRAKACISSLHDMDAGTAFRPVIAERGPDPGRVGRVLLCTGKIFYDLERERHDAGLDGKVRIVRIEQIHPLDADALRVALRPCPDAELVWVQEEPANQGAWPGLRDQLAVIAGKLPTYVGRPPMPASAGGSTERHEREQADILRRAYANLA